MTCCSKTHPSEAVEGVNEHVHVSRYADGMQSGQHGRAAPERCRQQIKGIPVWWHGRASGIVVFEGMPWAGAVVPLSEAGVAARRGTEAVMRGQASC